MRPRLLHRGNRGRRRRGRSPPHQASMRPRLLHRGNPRARRHRRNSARARFNEAPAASPGKSGPPPGPTCASRRASMRPRLLHRGNLIAGRPVRRNDARLASMRPRLLHRGNLDALLAIGRFEPSPHASMRPRLLHRGNRTVHGVERLHLGRFNEAPAASPGKSQAGLRSLRRRPAASMRPRLLHRGNLCRPVPGVGRREQASMRPRLLHRGNLVYNDTAGCVSSTELQ